MRLRFASLLVLLPATLAVACGGSVGEPIPDRGQAAATNGTSDGTAADDTDATSDPSPSAPNKGRPKNECLHDGQRDCTPEHSSTTMVQDCTQDDSGRLVWRECHQAPARAAPPRRSSSSSKLSR